MNRSEATNRGKRSVPNRGKTVQIICGCPSAEGQGYMDEDVFFHTAGEDFAVSNWPIVVKCDTGLTRQAVVNHLLWLAAKLDY